jgi:hypothetical protein
VNLAVTCYINIVDDHNNKLKLKKHEAMEKRKRKKAAELQNVHSIT